MFLKRFLFWIERSGRSEKRVELKKKKTAQRKVSLRKEKEEKKVLQIDSPK